MWLLVGGDSEIGSAAYRTLKAAGRPVVATTRRPDRASAERPLLDLAAPLDRWEPPADTRAACIFAAVARLAACADDPAGTAKINVTQTLTLAERLLQRGIAVLFLSTNQVFDGRVANMPADAPTSPTSEYGRQKARVEARLRELMSQGAPVSILRLAKVVSNNMPLIHGWVDALAAGRPIRAFHDMTMAPTPTDLVIAAIAALMEECATGVFQLTGPKDVFYSDVASHVAGAIGADRGLVEAVSATTIGMPEGTLRPHTTLDSTALVKRHGLSIPGPWEVIDGVVKAARSSKR